MKRKITALLSAFALICFGASAREFSGSYSGTELDHIAYPIGGIGTGMFCFEGTGAISNLSLWHYPDLYREPLTFASICVKGVENGTKVLEGNVPDYKKFGRREGGMGVGHTTWGLPRFENAEFSAHFPFATLNLSDRDLPLEVSITAWNPFIPGNADDSGLPVAGFEYVFTNTSPKDVEAIFSFNTENFMFKTHEALSCVEAIPGGFVLRQDPTERSKEFEGRFAIYSDAPETVTDCCWFRGGWFDPLTMAWNHASDGQVHEKAPSDGAPGASLYIPLKLKAGESRTVVLKMCWYVPSSNQRMGIRAREPSDFGSRYAPEQWKDLGEFYKPYYSARFESLEAVVEYWNENYSSLKAQTEKFTQAFYDTTLPREVVEAVAANLTILKSTTTARQSDGRFWCWEGSGDSWGSCHGSCTHVWNYAQAVPHLFPELEKSLRNTEFLVDQDSYGHQMFRANLPISPVRHDFHSAADGQLGGIIKVYRDWRINGDTPWLEDLYPQIKQSLDYCIRTWDPREEGAIEEPHHNTYDIEFWGPGGMCTSFYAGALNAFIKMSKALGKDCKYYERLLSKSQEYMTTKLWNGEYFYQRVRWKDLSAPDPTQVPSFGGSYSPEAVAIMNEEGPKYQYGTGCLSDGVIGCWMSLAAGLDEPIDPQKVKSHLESVYKYNLKHDLLDHSNPQRPGYALGRDGGLLLCTWPKGGKPNLPFVYSDEVWTGIEYQVASHLMFEGEVEKGLDIVRTLRSRYDGTLRNPFNEYECGSWYARALASYSMIHALTGVRYDAVDKTLYIDSHIGDFRSFLSTATGYATVGLERGKPFIKVLSGEIDIKTCLNKGKKTKLNIL